ncbi:hypothetical protein [Streptomyces sp. NPDC001761]
MDAVAAISLLRMAAADLAVEPWQRPSDAYLVELGLDALTAGVEVPSLPLLAGLARGECPQARELFDLVLEQLACCRRLRKILPRRDGPRPSGGPARSWRADSIPYTERG